MIQLNLHVLYVGHGVIEPTALWVLKEEREKYVGTARSGLGHFPNCVYKNYLHLNAGAEKVGI